MSSVRKLAFAALCLLLSTCKEKDFIPVDLLNDPSVQPEVIYTYPPQNSTGPYDNFSSTITIRFNKLMDLTSLQHGVHISSSLGDVKPDTARVSSSTGDVASISPIAANAAAPFSWKVNQTYSLQIESSAKDINGNSLNPAFTMTFKPEPNFRVKSMTPSPGSVNVSARALIRLQFNSPVDTSVFSMLTIDPPLSGSWLYSTSGSSILQLDSTSVFFLYSGAGMMLGTSYTVSVNSSAHDKSGNRLTGEFNASFTTVPFGITNTFPGNGNTNVQLRQKGFSVSLNDGVDTSTVRESFQINPQIPGLFSFSSDLKEFFYSPLTELGANTTYTVTIDTTLRSQSGINLFQAFEYSFTTTDFKVTLISPSNDDTNVSASARLLVLFNADIDTESVRTAFHISPDVDGLLGFLNPGDGFFFSPIVSFMQGVTYNVTLDSTLQSKGGSHLTSPFSAAFSIATFKVLSTNPPDGGTHVPRDGTIYVFTTGVIDINTVPIAFNINPTVSGTFNFSAGVSEFTFTPDVPLQAFTIYNITIGTSLRTEAGVQLPTPYKFSFATGE